MPAVGLLSVLTKPDIREDHLRLAGSVTLACPLSGHRADDRVHCGLLGRFKTAAYRHAVRRWVPW
jgi:hypothetical protein